MISDTIEFDTKQDAKNFAIEKLTSGFTVQMYKFPLHTKAGWYVKWSTNETQTEMGEDYCENNTN